MKLRRPAARPSPAPPGPPPRCPPVTRAAWSGGTGAPAGSDQLSTWACIPSAPLVATAPGLSHRLADSPAIPHPAGHQNSAGGDLLVSAGRAAGLAATLPGQSRCGSVSPLALAPAASAIVMPVPVGSEAAQLVAAHAPSSAAPGSYGIPSFGATASLTYPTATGIHSPRFFGPSLQFIAGPEVPAARLSPGPPPPLSCPPPPLSCPPPPLSCPPPPLSCPPPPLSCPPPPLSCPPPASLPARRRLSPARRRRSPAHRRRSPARRRRSPARRPPLSRPEGARTRGST